MAIDQKSLGKPSKFWEYFLDITKIPRCSGQEARVRSYIAEKAEAMHYSTKVDEAGNLLVFSSNFDTPKKGKTIILQSHMDMVCEKNKNSMHNFAEDPLTLKLIMENGEKWLEADGTTLGADNGGGIAFNLAIMDAIVNNELSLESSKITFLFTVEEETGLLGAFNIQKEFLEGDYLINLDSENENKFTIGCAGGITTVAMLPIDQMKIEQKNRKLRSIHLSVKGLRGGHSGVDINKGRGNAIKILATLLWKANQNYKISLNMIGGGNLSNAIPREAECIFYVEKNDFPELNALLEEEKAELTDFFSKSDPNLNIKWIKLNNSSEQPDNAEIYSRKMSDTLINLLYIIPNGALRIASDNPALVITSSNLASIKKEKDNLKLTISHRSLYESAKEIVAERIEGLFNLTDLNISIYHQGDYPGWQPNYNSTLLKRAEKTYKNLFKKDPIIQTIHAGLETGILKKKFPHIEMISIGPTIEQGHSPQEKLKINSIVKIWDFLKTFLKELDSSHPL